MKLSIRRHGIVIRTMEFDDKQVKVGSDPECKIHLDDPYLEGHVADIVSRGDDWYIVDSGVSMDGVTRNGQRVMDEPLLPGEVYSVGAFEIVPAGFEVSSQTLAGMKKVEPADLSQAATQVGGMSVPTAPGVTPTRTVPDEDAVPKTELRDLSELRKAAGFDQTTEEPKKQSFKFAPVAGPEKTRPESEPAPPLVPLVPQPAVEQKPAKGGSNKAIIILAAALLLFLVVLTVLVVTRGKGGDSEEAVQETVMEEPTAPAKTPEAIVAEGDQLARSLQIPEALAKWEEAMNRGAQGSVRDRYVTAVMELAQAHAAAHDPAKAKAYYQKVLQYGTEGNPPYELAKARLQGD